MEKKIAKVLYQTSGSGSRMFRVSIPAHWADQMGIKKEALEIRLELNPDEREIKIKKL